MKAVPNGTVDAADFCLQNSQAQRLNALECARFVEQTEQNCCQKIVVLISFFCETMLFKLFY